ncbi:unnamed protein product [Rotaria magnacalcarata]|uniref:Uncharacterized protein n=2 Tax=Rotaria magnacalcarata TaxID=392030 RepID=A0A814QWL5_9BILA|nr:unnamed protein product [Rotaria magnacalcarata]CAF1672961.1 unnamed protein product [Rotaria magnacalcarata]CAF2149993.1 unnamed protein product [Rotaria magnacalcarata]CAF2156247.1 unnamed protein product [Rotaria magnacalcarata]CAF2215102.1 unnamed protein product [Rotaria magnacalcarata]
MNIARCLNSSNNKEIILTTRETQLYIDAITGVKLNKWTNPYMGDTESVMHVANDPVQRTISTNDFSIEGYLTSENQVVLSIDVYLFWTQNIQLTPKLHRLRARTAGAANKKLTNNSHTCSVSSSSSEKRQKKGETDDENIKQIPKKKKTRHASKKH